MVLVDSSVWIFHLREGDERLKALLIAGQVVCHPFIIGELACGSLESRREILSLLQSLPEAIQAGHGEVMKFTEDHGLLGKGLGYVDVHLMASALLTGVPLWTRDKRLHKASTELGIGLKR
jgi:predicted nucleic acid-binding protein